MKWYYIPILLVIGALIGGIGTYSYLSRKTPVNGVISSETTTQKNQNEITNKTVAKVESKPKEVIVTTTLDTPYYGEVKTITKIDRKNLQYRHGLGLGGVYIDGGIYGRVHYEYNGFYTAFYMGYHEQWAWGFGVGYTFRF